jgi:S-adenosylmethionine hydrolase
VVEELQLLDFPEPELQADAIEASVLAMDRFGNITFDLSRQSAQHLLPPNSHWILAGREVPVGVTYSDVPPGSPILLWSSHDLLELACRQGRADRLWQLTGGQRVRLLRSSDG